MKFLYFCVFLLLLSRFQLLIIRRASSFSLEPPPQPLDFLNRIKKFGFGIFSDPPKSKAFYNHVQPTGRKSGRRREALENFKYTGALRKGKVSRPRRVPDGILRPPYVFTHQGVEEDIFPRGSNLINTHKDIEGIRNACKIARRALEEAKNFISAGITTEEIDKFVHSKICEFGAYPSPLLYKGFPKSVCCSVNEVICHGIPDSTILNDGDVITIDITCYYCGYHGDCADTVIIGEASESSKKLIEVAYESMIKGIAVCRPGEAISKIGEVIEEYITSNGFSSLNDFCGHGVGRRFHDEPRIFHVKNTEPGVMRAGMVFTVEPVVCEGSADYVTWPDDWTVATKDGKRSAQFENTVLITPEGNEILTRRGGSNDVSQPTRIYH